jgi:tetratricopeptide (TPR) repeat protein
MTTLFRITLVLAIAIIAGCGPDKPVGPDTEQSLLGEISMKFENPDAHYKLAKIYHSQKQWIKAEYEYNIAIGFAPDNQWPEAGLVKMYEDWGRTEKAQAAMDKALQTCVTDEELVMFAKALGKEGLHKRAQECYEYAIKVAKNKGGIYKEIGYYYLGIGDKVRAEDAFRKSLEIRPYQPDVSAELGRMGVKVVAPDIVHQKPATGAANPNAKLEEEIVNKK